MKKEAKLKLKLKSNTGYSCEEETMISIDQWKRIQNILNESQLTLDECSFKQELNNDEFLILMQLYRAANTIEEIYENFEKVKEYMYVLLIKCSSIHYQRGLTVTVGGNTLKAVSTTTGETIDIPTINP